MFEIKAVEIPARDNHEGQFATTVEVRWACPRCGHPRGEVRRGLSWDGSQRLPVDCWVNPCGHIDKYPAVRAEAAALRLAIAGEGLEKTERLQ